MSQPVKGSIEPISNPPIRPEITLGLAKICPWLVTVTIVTLPHPEQILPQSWSNFSLEGRIEMGS